MRIWAFPSMYPYDRPGMTWAGIFAHRQYKGLIANGAELKVIIPVPWNPPFPFSQLHPDWKNQAELGYPAQRTHDGVTIYHPRIANMRPNRFVKRTYRERYVDSIINFFRKNKIQLDPAKDIFYSQWLPDSAMVQEAAHLLGLKSGVLAIGDDVIVYPNEKPEFYDIFKKTWSEADARFAVADYLGIEADKLTGTHLPYDVIFMGVEHDFFKPGTPEEIAQTKQQYNIPSDKLIILTVASAIKRKGWLDLLDALVEVKKTNSNFVQVAVHSGASEFDLNEEAAKRGLAGHFLNLGEIKPTALNKLFNVADIFCLPSHWEGMANVVMESMSSGLPVITTRVSGHPEVIRESGITGILVPPKDVTALANAIQDLLTDKQKRVYLGANARQFIVNEWGNFHYNAAKLYMKLESTLKE